MVNACRKRFHGRSLTSFVLLLTFVWMSATGIVLYLGPPGGEDRRTGWSFLGLGRDAWMAQHITSSAVFLLASLIHIWINRWALWGYLHARARRGRNRPLEIALALALTAYLVLGTA